VKDGSATGQVEDNGEWLRISEKRVGNEVEDFFNELETQALGLTMAWAMEWVADQPLQLKPQIHGAVLAAAAAAFADKR